jgi:hypothetical protein
VVDQLLVEGQGGGGLADTGTSADEKDVGAHLLNCSTNGLAEARVIRKRILLRDESK